jgi:hypothetical protein
VTARELGEISLAEALQLVCLIALKDPRRHGRAGARWLRRFLEQSPGAGLDDVAFVTGCLCLGSMLIPRRVGSESESNSSKRATISAASLTRVSCRSSARALFACRRSNQLAMI